MQASEWIPFLDELANVADKIALRHFRSSNLRIETKADRTPVTVADREIEDELRARVGERHPELGVFGEERGEDGDARLRLIIDPIDATANFLRGIPVFATLLAIEDAGEIVAGMISAAALGTRWHAARGAGAWCGDRRLEVSAVSEFEYAQVFHGSIGGQEAAKVPPGFDTLLRSTHRQRGFGDYYQHCLVAEGCGEIAIDPVVHPWDIAPLQVLVEEAGGRATTLSGERSINGGSLVTTNGVLHERVLDMLATR